MSQSRQLAAIMFTDIVGYTALMGKDSNKALELVRISKEIQKPLVEKHHGQWLKEMGDGALAKFGTALDAVKCAIEIQRTSRADFDGDLRIGIHLGDITIENDDVYGDGVNVASRLESIADPGGIYISDNVEKSIRGQTDVQAKYLGEIQLKNVAYGVRTYAVQGVGLPIPKVKEDKELSGHFWAEVQRRGVVRVAISYLVVAMLLILLWDQLNVWGVTLPQWSSTALMTLLVICFPLALYLAWSYERSPQGFVRTTSEASWQNPLKGSQRKPLTGTIFLTVLLLIALLLYLFPRRDSQHQLQEIAESSLAPTSIEKSIAVLPFDNFSPKKEENQYLCDGVMEEIINQLSKIKSLNVRSRSSVEQFREAKPTSPEIGQKLKVTHLIEGSVQRIGDELKVVVQLIEASDDRHVWQESYEQPLGDIFQMQSDIAQNVASQLKIALTSEEQVLIETPATENLKAYELYLQAKQQAYNWSQTREKTDYENTLTLLQRAEREDPAFALPLARRAKFYWEARDELYGDEIVLDSILILANRAIALDPELDAAYLARSHYYQITGNPERAFINSQKAFQLSPNNFEANWYLGVEYFRSKNYIHGLQLVHRAERLAMGDNDLFWILHRLGIMYMALGDTKEAFHYWNRMEILEQNSSVVNFSRSLLHQYLKQWDSAYNTLQKLDSLKTEDLFYKNQELGKFYMRRQEISKVLNYIQKAATFQDADEWYHNTKLIYGIALCVNGRKEEGERLLKITLDEYLKIGSLSFGDREVQIAAIYAFLGSKQEAYNWLHQSNWTSTALYDVQQYFLFTNMREEKTFQDLINSILDDRKAVREEIARLKAAGEWEI